MAQDALAQIIVGKLLDELIGEGEIQSRFAKFGLGSKVWSQRRIEERVGS